jgi:hypothetical protein
VKARLTLVLLLGITSAVAGAQDSSSTKRPASPSLTNPGRREAVEALFLDFGVPSSPAFELLPDKPSEVTHVTTPKDLQANARTFFTGTELRTGMAVDVRPLSGMAQSLREYRKDPGKQLAWRTVLSFGTSARSTGSSDVVLALGLRLPVLDRGDPRADSAYISRLESAYRAALEKQEQPGLEDEGSDSLFQERANRASAAIQAVRDSFRLENWNALRLDLGVGGSLLATGGALQRDKVSSDRAGAWVALALPIWSIAEGTISGKGLWANADSSTQEAQRYLLGSRIRIFPVNWISFSVEGARVWSRYDTATLNESWNHFGAGVDVKLPLQAGWLSVAYGGDTSRRDDPDAMFSVEYAVFKERRMKR